MSDDDPGLGLDEVLAALRHDLVAARDDAGGADGYGLGVAEVEVELSVEVSRSVRGEGSVGAKWFVLSGDASGEASRDRSRAHRIKLTLRPTADGGAGAAGATGTGVGRSEAAETIGARIAGVDER